MKAARANSMPAKRLISPLQRIRFPVDTFITPFVGSTQTDRKAHILPNSFTHRDSTERANVRGERPAVGGPAPPRC